MAGSQLARLGRVLVVQAARRVDPGDRTDREEDRVRLERLSGTPGELGRVYRKAGRARAVLSQSLFTSKGRQGG